MANNVTEDLDKIFATAQTVAGACRDVNSTIGNACNQINYTFDSRRNFGNPNVYAQQYPQQPVQYGYGYADNTNIMNPFNQQQIMGYAGISDPAYGFGGGGMF